MATFVGRMAQMLFPSDCLTMPTIPSVLCSVNESLHCQLLKHTHFTPYFSELPLWSSMTGLVGDPWQDCGFPHTNLDPRDSF